MSKDSLDDVVEDSKVESLEDEIANNQYSNETVKTGWKYKIKKSTPYVAISSLIVGPVVAGSIDPALGAYCCFNSGILLIIAGILGAYGGVFE